MAFIFVGITFKTHGWLYGQLKRKKLGSEEINIEERTPITGYGGVNMSQGAKQLNEQGIQVCKIKFISRILGKER